MTSTSAIGPRGLLLAGLTLLIIPPAARAAEGDVELDIRTPGDHYYIVTGAEGGRFLARRFRNGDSRGYYKEFYETANGAVVGGVALGWDAGGKSTDVLPREPAGKAETQWDKSGGRFGMRLRVPAGPLKGMWVGLGVLKEDGKARGFAPLVLVKDRKDAAVFCWADPKDCGK